MTFEEAATLGVGNRHGRSIAISVTASSLTFRAGEEGSFRAHLWYFDRNRDACDPIHQNVSSVDPWLSDPLNLTLCNQILLRSDCRHDILPS